MLYSDFANPYKAVKSNALRNQWSPMALEKGGADKKKRNKDRTKDQQTKGTQNASKNALEVTGASSEPVPANNAVGTIVGKSKTNSARNRSEKGDPNLKEERFRALIDDMSVTKDVCATPAAVTKPSDALTPVHEPPVTKRVRFKLPEDVSSHMDEPAALLPRLVPQMA